MTDTLTARFPRPTLTRLMQERGGTMSNRSDRMSADRGRHQRLPNPRTMSPPNELGPSENARRAWQEGVAAAVEEMNDPKMSGIKGYYLMYFAIHNDMPLTSEQVKKVWDDRFLTNVIVPILEHIRRHFEAMLEDPDEIDPEDDLRTEHYERRMSDLTYTIDILREWRG